MISKLIKKIKDKMQESEDLRGINEKSIDFAINAMMPKKEKGTEESMDEEKSPKESMEVSEEKEQYAPMGKHMKHMGAAPETKVEIELMVNGAKKKKKS